ncbi:MAG TPA: macro domain-containing protein [Thermoanaerobaculia bacterium]|nr:macro domain-containing protein [Thermoanaerobaculia bacterium]
MSERSCSNVGIIDLRAHGIHYLDADLFSSPAQTLVNPVNTVGVLGAGLAKIFRSRYPAMFREYQDLCRSGRLSVGTLMLWRGPDRWVLNLPTKTRWQLPSTLAYIEAGLRRFREDHHRLGITSVAFPALGCGCGKAELGPGSAPP